MSCAKVYFGWTKTALLSKWNFMKYFEIDDALNQRQYRKIQFFSRGKIILNKTIIGYKFGCGAGPCKCHRKLPYFVKFSFYAIFSWNL